MYLEFLTGRDPILLPPQEQEKNPPCPVTTQPTGDCHNSTNEKSLYFKLSVSSYGLFIYSTPSQVHKKSIPLLCFSGLVCGSSLGHMSQTEILCCSQISPFCWRNICPPPFFHLRSTSPLLLPTGIPLLGSHFTGLSRHFTEQLLCAEETLCSALS